MGNGVVRESATQVASRTRDLIWKGSTAEIAWVEPHPALVPGLGKPRGAADEQTASVIAISWSCQTSSALFIPLQDHRYVGWPLSSIHARLANRETQRYPPIPDGDTPGGDRQIIRIVREHVGTSLLSESRCTSYQPLGQLRSRSQSRHAPGTGDGLPLCSVPSCPSGPPPHLARLHPKCLPTSPTEATVL